MLRPIVESVEVARRSGRLVKQNFAIALLYNLCAVPLAMTGLLTPLLAALAMSSSSLIVILNALRLARGSVVKDLGNGRTSLSDRDRAEPGRAGAGGVSVGAEVRSV
jgi:P-type Cu2+ transporter